MLLQPLLCPEMLRSGGNKAICSYWHEQLHLHLRLWVDLGQTTLSRGMVYAPVTQEAYCFRWMLGNICTSAIGRLTVWVNGHNSTEAVDVVWFCLVPFGMPVLPWLACTYSLPARNLCWNIPPRFSICVSSTFLRFQKTYWDFRGVIQFLLCIFLFPLALFPYFFILVFLS